MAIQYSASHGSNNGGAVAAGTIALTFTGSLVAGAGIALAIGHYRNTVTSVTDDVGNNYWQVFTLLTTITGKADNGIDVWVSDAANGQPTTITANYSDVNTLGRMICAASFTGVDFLEATGYDQRQTNEQESVIPWTSNTFTPTAGERLLLGAAKEGSGADNTSTPDAPWQELFDFGCGTGDSILFQYQIVTADGSTAYAATGNWTGAVGVYAAGGASLFPAAPGGPTDTTTRRYQIRRSRMTSW